jgi:hypothetical protein
MHGFIYAKEIKNLKESIDIGVKLHKELDIRFLNHP